uniref:Uncharacterized protein n=1 Tax=Romanomermis culicivorax TaxID=13658 RepID=A0A915K7L8_ROMCU
MNKEKYKVKKENVKKVLLHSLTLIWEFAYLGIRSIRNSPTWEFAHLGIAHLGVAQLRTAQLGIAQLGINR